MKIVSACLVGIGATYRGDAKPVPSLIKELKSSKCIPLCPEQLGGLPTPRPPAEIIGGSAEDVLKGKARVVRIDGIDVTEQYLRGAEEVLRIARLVKTEIIIFKEKSPSCGAEKIYDGTHNGVLIPGSGVTTALLRKNGFKVVPE